MCGRYRVYVRSDRSVYLNYLIIGLGKLGHIHLSKISSFVEGVTYKTVDSGQVESDLSEVPLGWNLKFDVVVISTPTNNHLEIVRKLKENFLNEKKIPLVLVEKPVGYTVKERQNILKILGTITESVQTNSTEVFSKVTSEIKQLSCSNKQLKKIKFKRTSQGSSQAEPFTDLIWHDFSILAEAKIITFDNLDSIKNICFTKRTKTSVHCSYFINQTKNISIEHEASYVNFPHEIDRKCTIICECGDIYEFDFMRNNTSLNSKIIREIVETDKIMRLWELLLNCHHSKVDHSHLHKVSKIFEIIEERSK